MDNTWAPLGTSLHHNVPLENCMENTRATLGNFGVTWVNKGRHPKKKRFFLGKSPKLWVGGGQES